MNMMQITEKKKNVANAELLLRLVVKDPKGKVLSDSGQMPSKSFVIQFLEFIKFMFDKVNGNATDVDGNESQIYNAALSYAQIFNMDAGINNSLFGIVVGSGDTAVSNTDYKLETQMTEGAGAGQITHNACTVDASAAVVGANVDLVLVRSFTNNTGAVRTVKEVGMYCRQSFNNFYHCVIRDVLGSSVAVPDKCSLTVYYTWRTTA